MRQRVHSGVFYLVSGGFVRGHVALQLCAVAEGVSTQRAAKALLILLMAIFDVFLQRRQALVATVTVRTGEQLGEVIRCARQQICSQRGQRSEGQWITGSNIDVCSQFIHMNNNPKVKCENVS